MGFVASTWLQRLLDLADQVMPNVATDTIARTPNSNRLPRWDPFECSPEDMADIKGAIDKMQLVYIPIIYRWGDVGMTLANKLAGLTLDTISIGCQDCKGPNFNSDSSKLPRSTGRLKYQMNICADVSSPSGAAARKSLIEQLVFRELISLADGNAVDYIGLFVYLAIYPQVPPPYIPGPSQLQLCLMKADGRPLPYPWDGYYAGKYTVWDGVHGGYYVGNRVDPTQTGYPLFTGSIGGLPNWQVPMMICP